MPFLTVFSEGTQLTLSQVPYGSCGRTKEDQDATQTLLAT
jgi:hypothetical protein